MTCPHCGQEIKEDTRIYLNLTHTRWKYITPRKVVIIGNMDKKGNPQYNKERTIEYYEERGGTIFAGLKINGAYFSFPIDIPEYTGLPNMPLPVIFYKGKVNFDEG